MEYMLTHRPHFSPLTLAHLCAVMRCLLEWFCNRSAFPLHRSREYIWCASHTIEFRCFAGDWQKNSRNFRLIDHIISLSRRGKLNLNSLHTIYFSFFFSLFSNSEVCARCCHELYALYVCKQLNFLLSEWKRKYELKNVNWIVLRAKSNWSRHRSLCFIWNENKMFCFYFSFVRNEIFLSWRTREHLQSRQSENEK